MTGRKKINKKDITDIIFSSIDEVNEYSTNSVKLTKNNTTILYGEGSIIDSLGLVHLIVSIERSIREKTGKAIVIASEKAMSQKNSPFKNVTTLVNFIDSLLS